jgi:N-ethylmaleimide reductase
MPDYLNDPLEFLREHYKVNIIGYADYNMVSAANAIMNKECDLISFGKPFISNPDLIKKIKNGEPLLPYNSEMLNRLF